MKLNIKLACELVPTGTWGANLRSLLPPSGWNRLRRWSYAQADNKCEICDSSGLEQGRTYPVECHEVWAYDDVSHTQTLIGVQSLCPQCHMCKHYGRSLKVGAAQKIRKHMKEVNDWGDASLAIYEDTMFTIHSLRSRFRWSVSIEDKLREYLDAGVLKEKDFDKALAKLAGGYYGEVKA